MLPDDPNSKLNACVGNILRIYEDGNADQLTQLVFCDLSTPKKDGTFNVYDDIKTKLMALDGYCINLDLRDVKEFVSLLRRCSNNLNQYAKRANETDSIYQDDIKDVQERLDEVWDAAKEMLVHLSSIS